MKYRIIEILEQIEKSNYNKKICFPLMQKFKEMLRKYGDEFEKCFIRDEEVGKRIRIINKVRIMMVGEKWEDWKKYVDKREEIK